MEDRVRAVLRRSSLAAIHEFDVPALLRELGLDMQHEAGKLRCFNCERSTRRAGIGGLRVDDERVSVSCSSLQCLARLEDHDE
jgi:hypothetical protein